MAAPTDVPIVIATADITLGSGSDNKKVPEAVVLTDGYGAEALPLNDLNYMINNHGLWLTYFKDEVVPSIDITNWNSTSLLLSTAANITPSGTYPDQDQNFQTIVEQGAGRAIKTVNNGTSGVTIKVTYPANQEAPQSYFNGLLLTVDVAGAFDGGGNCTLELDSLGAKAVYSKYGGGGTYNAALPVPKGVFNQPTEVYYDSALDVFIVKGTVEDRNFLPDEAIDIIPFGSQIPPVGSTSLGNAGTITLDYLTGGTYNYGKLLHGSINYEATFAVGQIIVISNLTALILPAQTLGLSGTYLIQSFSDGGLGMLIQAYNGGAGGDVEDVTTSWTVVPSSTGVNTDTTATATATTPNTAITIPYALSWTDFERLEVTTAYISNGKISGPSGVVTSAQMLAYPSLFESLVGINSSSSAGFKATANTTFDLVTNGDLQISEIKGYLRRRFI